MVERIQYQWLKTRLAILPESIHVFITPNNCVVRSTAWGSVVELRKYIVAATVFDNTVAATTCKPAGLFLDIWRQNLLRSRY